MALDELCDDRVHVKLWVEVPRCPVRECGGDEALDVGTMRDASARHALEVVESSVDCGVDGSDDLGSLVRSGGRPENRDGLWAAEGDVVADQRPRRPAS